MNIKSKSVSSAKALLIDEIKESVNNMKMVNKGKMIGQSLKDLLDGLLNTNF